MYYFLCYGEAVICTRRKKKEVCFLHPHGEKKSHPGGRNSIYFGKRSRKPTHHFQVKTHSMFFPQTAVSPHTILYRSLDSKNPQCPPLALIKLLPLFKRSEYVIIKEDGVLISNHSFIIVILMSTYRKNVLRMQMNVWKK